MRSPRKSPVRTKSDEESMRGFGMWDLQQEPRPATRSPLAWMGCDGVLLASREWDAGGYPSETV
jgi:hypothetical protein